MNRRIMQPLPSHRRALQLWPASRPRRSFGSRRADWWRGSIALLLLSSLFQLLIAGEPALVPGSPSSTIPTNDLSELSLTQLLQVQYDTVYGASKHEQKLADAPAAVTLVAAEDIKEYGYRTLGDLLRGVRGFYVTSDSDYNYVGVRGLNRPGDYGGRVLINIDGHRLNEPVFDSSFSSTEFLLDMDLVERVEVIRGPGSSLYGNNAFFTVINVVTRRGRDIGGFETSTSAASRDSYTGRITYGNRFTNGVELLVSGTYLESAGRDHFYFPEYSASLYNVFDKRYGDPVSADFKQETILQEGRTFRVKLTYRF